ncbi:MAG: DinB family protein [Candidatus Dormiibacterota bacterium]
MTGGRSRTLPPLAAEDHVCATCPMAFSAVSVEEARALIASLPARYRRRLEDLPAAGLRGRPEPAVWSPLEYLAHVRDVYVTTTIRLYRTRTEDTPALEPMLNDLRAARFRYDDLDPVALLDELVVTVAGCLEESRHFAAGEWERTATRLPTERRSARWLLRNAAHEGLHHLRDLGAA